MLLFHVDMIYLAKEAKRDVEKKLCFEMRTVTKSNHERDFFSFMSKRRKYADVASFSSVKEHFTHVMYMTALIRPSFVDHLCYVCIVFVLLLRLLFPCVHLL